MKLKSVYLIIYPMLSFLFLSMNSCAIKKHTDIDYGSRISGITNHPDLNIFSSKNVTESLKPVLIFVYGGNWNSGRKGLYNYVGRNFAKHDMITVLPDYTKSPLVNVDQMTTQIATSIKWVRDNIAKYGGDPERIYLTGHSAGGHLVALAAMNPKYGIEQGTIQGIILNDAAGLDMATYLANHPPTADDDYLTTWTSDPEFWKQVSPINFINEKTPRIKIYAGSNTYNSIISSNQRFLEGLKEHQPGASIEWLDKSHIPMVSQLFWPWNDRFKEVRDFMNE
ncbi:esterase [Nonlabens sp. YIK11]|uniref:alpha/beta hydrolase n=1 Tax=Nonlabens sp. YIK11 TaxID=1453349 RepID=UPI0006DC8B7C|nr:alpha/beta hydrolase [Nonlabens sp. YIK11]KQC32051.1 esterase [Nonlabens sp. YIK11]